MEESISTNIICIMHDCGWGTRKIRQPPQNERVTNERNKKIWQKKNSFKSSKCSRSCEERTWKKWRSDCAFRTDFFSIFHSLLSGKKNIWNVGISLTIKKHNECVLKEQIDAFCIYWWKLVRWDWFCGPTMLQTLCLCASGRAGWELESVWWECILVQIFINAYGVFIAE